MIHVTIPDTKSLVEPDGTRKYDAFNIHLNGAYHASVRYSHLLRLHEALKQEFNGRMITPDFPSKKLKKHLDMKSLGERRCALMRYLQAVVQHPVTSRHRITEKFFLDSQVESFRPSSSNISVDVHMCDGTKQTVRCSVENPTSVVLELFCRSVGVAPENIQYFGLFLAKNRAQGKGVLLERWLKNYESPYISLQLANLKSADGVFHKLIVRKVIWDTKVEDDLLTDPGAVNLLFTQAAADLASGNFAVPADILQRLRTLHQGHSWKEYLRLCHLQTSYGYEVLDACDSDYPSPDNRCDLRVGRRQIVISYADRKTSEPVESAFRATRIRVWKIVNQSEPGAPMMFQFEYLMARDRFEWITLFTDQAVLLSLYLQSIGAEILREHAVLPERVPNESESAPRKISPAAVPIRNGNSRYESFRDVLSSVTTNGQGPTTNEAFNTITDDDL